MNDALHIAANRGDLTAVQAALDNGLPVDAPDGAGYTPMRYAALAGYAEVMDLLRQRGAAEYTPETEGPILP